MNIKKQQENLINSIEDELGKPEDIGLKHSSFYHSVWFEPLAGRFLYADKWVLYEVVEPLILNKTLLYKGFETHQGQKMLRYVLANTKTN
jgi:hypothetical protein